jgi:hypothetical protein
MFRVIFFGIITIVLFYLAKKERNTSGKVITWQTICLLVSGTLTSFFFLKVLF